MASISERTQYKFELRKKSGDELLRSENINGLQWKRWFHWEDQLILLPNFNGHVIRDFLEVELALRECTQREVAAKRELETAYERLQQESLEESEEEKNSEVEALEKNIENLGKEYWFLERKWWSERIGSLFVCLGEGITLWRNTPSWWMHERLVMDCINRGGCCGRACNCCSDRRNIPGRLHARGHCTKWCHCCKEARGFELSSERLEELDSMFSFSSSAYLDFYALSSLLGLVEGNFRTNPSDMIKDKPPRYTPKVVNNDEANNSKGTQTAFIEVENKAIDSDTNMLVYDLSICCFIIILLGTMVVIQ